MALRYERPTERLRDELTEVQRDAAALAGYLRQTNLPLPRSFPQKALLDLASALAELPDGTARGARQSLTFAQERLAGIRGEHIAKEDTGDVGTEAAPRLLRREPLDDLLTGLLSSVSTALQVANRDIADAQELRREPDPSIEASRDDATRNVVRQVRGAQQQFISRRAELDSLSVPGSSNADRLRRRITDVVTLSQIVRTELAMPRIIPAWLKHLGDALRDYPKLIVTAATAMRAAADIGDWAHDKWDKFNSKLFRAGIDTLREVANDISNLGRELDEKRRRSARRPSERMQDIDDYSAYAVRNLILAGRPVPEAWQLRVEALDFGHSRLADLSGLVGLDNVTRLILSRTKVSDLGPLTALGKLEQLELARTAVRDINPLAFLSNLSRLDVDGLAIDSIEALRGLKHLQRLDLSHTGVVDLGPLSGMRNLRHLDLSRTQITDLSPLADLPNLSWLDVSYTQASDLTPLFLHYGLRYLDVTGSRVTKQDIANLGEIILRNLELLGAP
jgi:hypothetical protein